MNVEPILLLGILLTGFLATVALAFALASRRRSALDDNALTLVQRQLDQLRNDLTAREHHQSLQVERVHQDMSRHLASASRNVAEVNRHLGVLEQATERVLEVGRTVADIETLLRAPKLRGVLGELLLGELLEQALPKSLFELQREIGTGARVDAAIRVGERWLPVDAKFPLDNLRRLHEATDEAERQGFQRAFARDFKKHVDDIAAKYIVPESNTLPLAFLYVPAENVYQQGILAEPELAEYAIERRVVPVGPLGFFAFLQVLLLGARTLAAPTRAGDLVTTIEQVSGELEALRGEAATLGRHLDNARSGADRLASRIRRAVDTITRSRESLDSMSVAGPPDEEGR